MAKRKKPRRGPEQSAKPTALKVAACAIDELARKNHTTPEMVRKHIQVGLMNGLISDDPAIQEALRKIPTAGEVPTPEEVIAYYATQLSGRMERTGL